MDMQTVETLCQLNTDFYRRQCRSFADTRHAPWPGWTRCLQAAGVIPADDVPGEKGPSSKQPPMQHPAAEPPAPYPRTLSVLDVACGNLRFESFLRERLPQTRLDLHAVDNCDSLAAEGQADGAVHFQHVDVMRALLEGVGWDEDEPAPLCDMTVCFGFMHHVPGRENRMNLMRELVRRTLPGGYVAVSFWQFLNDEGLAAKARATHAHARDNLHLPMLDEGDFVLGWKGVPGAYRYCHSFSQAEITQLVDAVAGSAPCVDRFTADGRTGNLNAYVVLRAVQ